MLGPRRVLADGYDTRVRMALYQRAAKLARAHGACSPIQAAATKGREVRSGWAGSGLFTLLLAEEEMGWVWKGGC